MQLNLYLYFNGNCEEAFKYYEKNLGGKIEVMLTNEGSPAADHIPSDWNNKILHARMKLGNTELMASDAPPGYFEPQHGFSASLTLNDPTEAERVFNVLAVNGKIQMPFEETFWAYRFGMVTDQFGIPWMVNCEKPA